MNGARFVILVSARLLASPDRGSVREAWLADLHHCERAGVTPWQIAVGAALTAASPHNLRARLTSGFVNSFQDHLTAWFRTISVSS